MIRTGFILFFVLLLPASAAAGVKQLQASLPPVECVRLLRQARIAEIGGEPAVALGKLQSAVAQYPGQLAPIVELLAFGARHELADEQAAALRRSMIDIVSNPDAPLPRGTLGFLVNNEDTTNQESEAILKAIHQRVDPDAPDPELLRMAAVMESRLDRLEDARETLNLLIRVDPDPALIRQRLYLDMHLEDWAAAAATLESLLEADDSPLDRALYIRVLGKLGRYDDLIRQTELLEEGSPRDLLLIRDLLDDLLVQTAWNLRDAGRDQEAEALFRRILKGDPDHEGVQATLFHLYSTEEDRARRLQQIEEQWDSEENLFKILHEGVDRVAAGDVEGGIGFLERAARGMKGSDLAWYNLGLAALRLERWELAEEAFAAASRLDPDRMESVLYHGAALQALGRFQEAIESLNRAQAMNPDTDTPEVHFYLYRCHRGLKDARNAARELSLYNRSRGN